MACGAAPPILIRWSGTSSHFGYATAWRKSLNGEVPASDARHVARKLHVPYSESAPLPQMR